MIVSLDESSGAWSRTYTTTGANDGYDGLVNTNLIVSNYDINDYPAFQWCVNKNTNGITGWYLPSKNEVRNIILFREELNVGLLNNGGTILENRQYWSSCEGSSNIAISYDHTYGDPFRTSDKKSGYRIRAVHSF